jgi:hypothetical protein
MLVAAQSRCRKAAAWYTGRQCSGMALYCSKECQLKDRPLHKQHCKLAQLVPPDQMQSFLQAAGRAHA